MGVPSIKDALQGIFKEDKISSAEQHKIFSKDDKEEDFTREILNQKWNEFLARLEDRPNLKSTLSNPPVIKESFQLVLEIENTIQEGLINEVKPELVSWLRKELKNSKIQLITIITNKIKGRIIYTDGEKFEEMVKINPNLAVLKQKFKLDFGQ